MEQIQAKFFAKENISNLNKILLQQTNKQNIPRELKQEIINVLIKNMKIVFKQIDLSKVNSNNINTLFEQFKNHSLRNTINEIQSPSDLKFNRDFNSNPTKGNKLMERPTSTKFNEPTGNNSFSGFDNSFEANLDQAFKPIVTNSNDQNQFNNYTNGRNKDDIKSLMSDIQQSRTQELNSRNQRPSTPEFLKPKKTSNKEETPTRMTDFKIQNNSNAKLDFKNSTSDQFNIGFQGLSNDVSADLFSLDNIDKPLIEEEIEEDNSSFDDRLKRLQSDRGSLAISNNQGKIDFTTDKFPNSDIGDNTFMKIQKPKQQDPQSNRQVAQRDQIEQQERQRQQIAQRDQIEQQERQRQQVAQRDQIEQQERQRQQATQRDQIEQQERQRQQVAQRDHDNTRNIKNNMNRSIDKATENPNINNLKSKMKTMNINVKSDNLKIQELERENRELKEIIENEESKLNDIKKQIANEFHLLESKEIEISKKNNELELKELELVKRNNELELKEIDFNSRNQKYDYLFKSNFLQIEVSDINNNSSYKWKINKPITNVIGIKLMSYSITQSIFNINKYNNHLIFKINEETININIDEGKYNIDEIITIFNNKLTDIKLSINNQQKIIFESDNNFDIISTCMSKEIFGFTLDYNNNNKYISNNIWDLRISDKIYLYLNNISDNPFGILYFNGHSDIQIKFKDPFDIDLFDVSFKDVKGREIEFNNLPHSLSFVIEQLNN